jgi:hypothetical protein
MSVIVPQYYNSKAKHYSTSDFVFSYDTYGNIQITFVDNYGRKQEQSFLQYKNNLKMGSENKLTYKVLTNKKKTCSIEEVIITKEVADKVEFPYRKTLSASTSE